MISKTQENIIQRSDVFVEQTFKINASAKAFEILSAGLYSDRVTSVIRELSCNSYDSHVASGNLDTPFLVHLPNTLEPFFSIRDYGTGLSDEDVMNIYTTYFQSTKSASNDYVGFMGLGSKSPFAITDSFTVTSFYNGKKTVYNAFKNEQNLPTIVLMSQEDTTEPNGVEIMFSVRVNDFSEFISKTPIVYQYFKIQPKIVGADVTPVVVEYFMKKDGWAIRNNNNYRAYGTCGARAIMGNISYPLTDYPASDLTDSEKAVLGLCIDIDFNIGELDVSASREKLSYDTATKANIKNKLANVSQEIILELENKISVCTSMWDARVMMYSLKHGEYSVFSKLIEYATITWNGIKITNSNTSHTEYVDIKDLVDKVEAYIYRNCRKGLNFESIQHIPVKDSISFFIRDIGKHLIPRSYQFYTDKQCGLDKHTLILFKEKVRGGIEELKKFLGMDSGVVFQNFSTLPYDATAIAQSAKCNPKNKLKVLKYNPNGNRGHRSHSGMWDVADVDMNVGGVYVKIDRYEIYGRSPASYINTYYRGLESIGEILPDVIGVKPSECSKFSTNANWKTLHDYTIEKMSQFVATYSMDENTTLNSVHISMCLNTKVEAIYNLMYYDGEMFKDDVELTEAYVLVNKMKSVKQNSGGDILKNALKEINNIHAIKIYGDMLTGDQKKQSEYLATLQGATEYIKNRYPLLKFVPSYRIKDNMTDIMNYINSIRNIKNELTSV